MKCLFIDTHSEKVVMFIDKDGRKYTREIDSEKSHSEVAVSCLEALLKESCLEASMLDEIIVVNGPGSFTGVRIGVTIAKTIAFSFNIPIKTITSLEMFGVSASEIFDLVTVADSKGVYSARFEENKFVDFKYQKNTAFEDMVKTEKLKVLNNKKIDFDKILIYMKDKESQNPHLVNPIYIKEIDVLK